MHKLVLTTLILAITSLCFSSKAQENTTYLDYYLTEGNTYYIYSDKANVRNGAGIAYDQIDQLSCGDEITYIAKNESKNNTYTINNIESGWVRISYSKNQTTLEGYIWEGNISPAQLRRGDTKFVFGVDSYNNVNNTLKSQIKTVINKEIVSRTNYENTTIGFVSAQIIDDAGITGIEKVIKLYFSGEACGIPSVEHFIGWDGKKTYYITQTYSVGDAGIYGYSESIIFPKGYDCDGCDIVIKLISEYQNDDENSIDDIDFKPDYKYKSKVYIWNGKKLIEQDQSWKDVMNNK